MARHKGLLVGSLGVLKLLQLLGPPGRYQCRTAYGRPMLGYPLEIPRCFRPSSSADPSSPAPRPKSTPKRHGYQCSRPARLDDLSADRCHI